MLTEVEIVKKLISITSNDYPEFAEYCRFIDCGLRKDALKKLDIFIKIANEWDFQQKMKFCKCIFDSEKEITHSVHSIFTHNLKDKIIKPTLLELTRVEPDNYFYFKLYGQLFDENDFLLKSYQLNPTDDSVQKLLLDKLENDLWLATHHLPENYLGDFDTDEKNLKFAFSILEKFNSKSKNEYYEKFIVFKKEIDIYKSGK